MYRFLLLNFFTISICVLAWSFPIDASPQKGVVTGKDSFYSKHGEGWFFYNEKYNEKKKIKKKKKPTVTTKITPKPPKGIPQVKPVYTGPPPLSAAWLKVNLPKYLNHALDDPSPQNVRAYLILQKVSLDKSERFTGMAQRVTITDPLLDELTRRPFATAGVNVASAIASQQGDLLMEKIGSEMGLWVFYSNSANCPYCRLVGLLVSATQRIYGFKVLPISLDGSPPPTGFPIKQGYRVDSGQAAKMNVVATPAIYLVNIKKKEYVSVGQGGSMSIPELRQRIFLAALQKHWITNDQYAKALPNNNIKLLSDSDKLLHPNDVTGFIPPADVVRFMEKSFYGGKQ